MPAIKLFAGMARSYNVFLKGSASHFFSRR